MPDLVKELKVQLGFLQGRGGGAPLRLTGTQKYPAGDRFDMNYNL